MPILETGDAGVIRVDNKNVQCKKNATAMRLSSRLIKKKALLQNLAAMT